MAKCPHSKGELVHRSDEDEDALAMCALVLHSETSSDDDEQPTKSDLEFIDDGSTSTTSWNLE